MSYLDMLKSTDAASDPVPAATPAIRHTTCRACGQPLRLPESQALGRCVRCQTAGEWVNTLARMRVRHERTRAAVAARLTQLQMEESA